MDLSKIKYTFETHHLSISLLSEFSLFLGVGGLGLSAFTPFPRNAINDFLGSGFRRLGSSATHLLGEWEV